MQFVLLIYQGKGWGEIETMSDDDKRSIGAEYTAVNATPGVTPGLPLGLPEDATTVRVQDGKSMLEDGPFISTEGAIGGYVVFEARDLDAAIDLGARIPAARLGGAIEVRPVSTYW
jgi:hypothetical protein